MLVLGLVDVPLWCILTVAGAILLYLHGTRTHGFFKGTGIPGPKPWPYIGNFGLMIFQTLLNYDTNLKKKYGKIVGTFGGSTPEIVLFDEEMISQVTVKQFPYFQNRRTFDNGDQVMESMLTQLKDDQWKHARSTMSPTFTTRKLRKMSDEINRCAKQFAATVTSIDGPFETSDYSGRYTMDVIASTAFGLRIDSQTDKDNVFVKHGRQIMDLPLTRFFLGMAFPSLFKILTKLGFPILNKESMKFFVDVIKQTLETRTQDTGRSDFIQIMSNARRGQTTYSKEEEDEVEKLDGDGSTSGLSENEVIGNALVFFLAGFDTTNIGLTQLLYNLACNPDCQEKVYKEIKDVLGDKEDVDYDSVTKLHYLDMCMHESLRIYTPAPRVDRVTKQDIEINGIQFKKGTVAVIPVYALHHDPEIWEDPEKFKPERFSQEEKTKRSPVMWLPFGYGPRNCIGMRLAIYELKLAVVHLLKNHKLVTCEKTEQPLKMHPKKWMKAQNGVWLAIEKR